MEVGKSFVDYFAIDLTSYILGFLNDPADLIRFSAVSHSSRHVVIEKGICKQLCLRKIPQITNIAFAVQESNGIIKLWNIPSTNSVNWENLVTEHKIYSALLHPLSMQIISPTDIIGPLVGVLSTDPYLEEDIVNNLSSIQRRYMVQSYSRRYPRGSSNLSTYKGESDSNVPEYIMSRLKAGIYIVSEVNMWLFKARPGMRVCSAKLVRFRIGHPKSIADVEMKVNPVEQPFLDKYEWSYTSPLFPMMEEAFAQQFKLPEPVICAGDVFLVELFGWAQRSEVEGLFYTGMASIEILGQSLEPAYNLEILPSGELQLNYYPHLLDFIL